MRTEDKVMSDKLDKVILPVTLARIILHNLWPGYEIYCWFAILIKHDFKLFF